MPTIEQLTCAVCGRVTPYEKPPCVDGHEVDCPEWTCTRCGEALLVAPPTQDVWGALPVGRHRKLPRHRAPTRRHAA